MYARSEVGSAHFHWSNLVNLSVLIGYQRITLLQGPMGSFFRRLSAHLKRQGLEVQKINFNFGELAYYPRGAANYRGSFSEFESFFEHHLTQHRTAAIVLYGDCRPYHQIAIAAARRHGVAVFVFEEGYLRPDYVTFEPDGVNALSTLHNRRIDHIDRTMLRTGAQTGLTASFLRRAVTASAFYALAFIGQPLFRQYRHHRVLNPFTEALHWLKSALVWAISHMSGSDRKVQQLAAAQWSRRYTLVALQLDVDSQVQTHSQFESNAQFAAQIVASFAQHALPTHRLVVKQHPFDLGHIELARRVRQAALHAGVADRVHFVRVSHTTTLVKHAAGVVTINSTVGMSALHHGTSVLALGRAIYALAGLTHQGSLRDFWTRPAQVQRDQWLRFRQTLKAAALVNGCFYGRFPEFEAPTAPQLSQSIDNTAATPTQERDGHLPVLKYDA